MSNKPRIYVSSTIFDFADLRSALKYWLEEFDFEVQMSEFNDFEVNLNLNSFQACLESINKCDYFILLIGERKGAWFNEREKISITQQEYRTAYEIAKKGNIKIITFIRKSIWNIKEDRKAIKNEIKDEDTDNIKSKRVENPEFIFPFIDEVRCVEEMKQAIEGKSGYPPNNWIYLFSNFKDIFDALKIHLNLSGDLRDKAIKCSLKDELERNLIKSDIQIKDGIYSGNIIRILKIKNIINIDKTTHRLDIEKKWLFPLAIAYILFRFDFGSYGLKEAIKSGIFLEYNKEKGEFTVGKIQRLLLRLNEYIEQIENIFNSEMTKSTKEYFVSLIRSSKILPDNNYISVDIAFLISAIASANIYWNIYQISLGIYNFLCDKTPMKIELYPKDILSGQNTEIIDI